MHGQQNIKIRRLSFSV